MTKKLPSRYYDGNNSDLSFQLSFIGIKKKKLKITNQIKKIEINDYLIFDNPKSFYNKRIKNYTQMISDFTKFNINSFLNVKYLSPIIISKDKHNLVVHVKVDELLGFRFIKFNFVTLSNEICFHNYKGDDLFYITNEITKNNGYTFYINNKKINKKNLNDVINFYLKKNNIKETIYKTDHTITLTDNLDDIVKKYLNRPYLGKNLYIRNHENNIQNLYGVFLSRYDNFLFIIQNCNNFAKSYEEIVPTIENSYDLLNQYILLNNYLISYFSNFNSSIIKMKDLKLSYENIIIFKTFRENLLKKSFGTVSFILKEYEKNTTNDLFTKKINKLQKNIEDEFKNRKFNYTDFATDLISKSTAELYGKLNNN